MKRVLKLVNIILGLLFRSGFYFLFFFLRFSVFVCCVVVVVCCLFGIDVLPIRFLFIKWRRINPSQYYIYNDIKLFSSLNYELNYIKNRPPKHYMVTGNSIFVVSYLGLQLDLGLEPGKTLPK